MLFGYLGKLRKQVKPKDIDRWLNNLKGWAQVDSLCQSNFTAKDLLDNWNNWKRFLIKLSKDKNINKRRASLVFLTKPVRDSNDRRLAKLALKNINKLKAEKEILITKAISWLLRDMIKNHRKKVESYLKENSKTLPKIAVRETKKKLLTGRK